VKRLRVKEGADRATYGVMPILEKNCWDATTAAIPLPIRAATAT